MHIGLWLNYGAWSGANTPPYYNAGVEPTGFPHDDLNASARGQNSQLPPAQRVNGSFQSPYRSDG